MLIDIDRWPTYLYVAYKHSPETVEQSTKHAIGGLEDKLYWLGGTLKASRTIQLLHFTLITKDYIQQ